MRFLFLLFFLAGCGDSPLLNHKKAAGIGRITRGLEARSFARLGVGFDLHWKAGCPSFDDCAFQLELTQPLPENNTIFAELWMPSMGHGSSPITIKQLGASSWDFTDVYFIMAGDWEVILKVKEGSKVRDEVRLDYRL